VVPKYSSISPTITNLLNVLLIRLILPGSDALAELFHLVLCVPVAHRLDDAVNPRPECRNLQTIKVLNFSMYIAPFLTLKYAMSNWREG